jgi:hypothetical protein
MKRTTVRSSKYIVLELFAHLRIRIVIVSTGADNQAGVYSAFRLNSDKVV